MDEREKRMVTVGDEHSTRLIGTSIVMDVERCEAVESPHLEDVSL